MNGACRCVKSALQTQRQKEKLEVICCLLRVWTPNNPSEFPLSCPVGGMCERMRKTLQNCMCLFFFFFFFHRFNLIKKSDLFIYKKREYHSTPPNQPTLITKTWKINTRDFKKNNNTKLHPRMKTVQVSYSHKKTKVLIQNQTGTTHTLVLKSNTFICVCTYKYILSRGVQYMQDCTKQTSFCSCSFLGPQWTISCTID